jgi:hypothetical protein
MGKFNARRMAVRIRNDEGFVVIVAVRGGSVESGKAGRRRARGGDSDRDPSSAVAVVVIARGGSVEDGKAGGMRELGSSLVFRLSVLHRCHFVFLKRVVVGVFVCVWVKSKKVFFLVSEFSFFFPFLSSIQAFPLVTEQIFPGQMSWEKNIYYCDVFFKKILSAQSDKKTKKTKKKKMADKQSARAHTPFNPKAIADAKNEAPRDREAFSCFSEAEVPISIRDAATAGKYSVTVAIPNKGDLFGRLSSAEIVKLAQAYLRLCKIEGVTVDAEKDMCIVRKKDISVDDNGRVIHSSSTLQLSFTW